ncbi:hypothetical protein [Longimonas sp.]|uniref:hypothetical protein n=1 Tax=Longimonas sp. TaxID=2039626 RepID=UPI0033653709
MLEGFDRPVVQKVDSLTRYDADYTAMQQYAQTLTEDSIGEERMQVMRTLIQAGDAITAFVDAIVQMQQGIFQAVEHIDPDAAPTVDPALFESQARETAISIIPMTMFYMYQDVPTETLQAYADFYTSEAGQWYHQVRSDAEAYAEEHAAERLVTRVQQAVEARGEE